MTFEVLHRVLQFAVNSLVKLLDETNPRGFYLPMMRVNVIEKNRQALQVVTKFRRRRSIRLGSVRHDVRVREPQLRARDFAGGRIDVVILLDESEMFRKPVDRRRQIAIADMRQNRIDRHRSIFHSDWMIVAEFGCRVSQSPSFDDYAGSDSSNGRRSKRAGRHVD
jgi:hypothetical protein